MIFLSRLIWLLTGGVWAARSLISFAGPDYWDPVTALDWSAVWLFSVALLLFAPSVLLLGRLAPSRGLMTAATVVAVGALVAGVANALEDGFGMKALGWFYVVGFLTAGLGLLPLTATFRQARCPRLAWLSALLFLGLLLFTMGGGLLILGGLGAVAIAPSWFARCEPEPAATADMGAEDALAG